MVTRIASLLGLLLVCTVLGAQAQAGDEFVITLRFPGGGRRPFCGKPLTNNVNRINTVLAIRLTTPGRGTPAITSAQCRPQNFTPGKWGKPRQIIYTYTARYKIPLSEADRTTLTTQFSTFDIRFGGVQIISIVQKTFGVEPTVAPGVLPTVQPTEEPTEVPSEEPTGTPIPIFNGTNSTDTNSTFEPPVVDQGQAPPMPLEVDPTAEPRPNPPSPPPPPPPPEVLPPFPPARPATMPSPPALSPPPTETPTQTPEPPTYGGNGNNSPPPVY